jgi:hypothetical protein
MKSARAKINAASIYFLTRCRSGGSDAKKADDAIGYAKHYSRSHEAVIRVYDEKR